MIYTCKDEHISRNNSISINQNKKQSMLKYLPISYLYKILYTE